MLSHRELGNGYGFGCGHLSKNRPADAFADVVESDCGEYADLADSIDTSGSGRLLRVSTLEPPNAGVLAHSLTSPAGIACRRNSLNSLHLNRRRI